MLRPADEHSKMGEAEMRNRISIITAVVALSIASVGPFTSVASARRPVKIGKIEVECPVLDKEGNVVGWLPEGTLLPFEDANGVYHYYTCSNGHWVQVGQEAPSTPRPPTTRERPTTPPVLAP
jgi:hypothetical protein